MDLFSVVVFVIVSLVSFGSILFINRFLRGKSFEEIVREKNELRRQVLGAAAANSGSTSGSNKSSLNKDNKKGNKKGNVNNQKKGNLKQQQQQQQQQQKAKESTHEDSESSSSAESETFEEEINPLMPIKRKINNSVEYTETEPFAVQPKNTQKSQQQQKKSKKGILINKSEPVLVKSEPAVEINHFEEMHPKDEIERIHDEISHKTSKSQPKEQRKNKHHHQQQNEPQKQKDETVVKATPPVSPKIESKNQDQTDAIEIVSKQTISTVSNSAASNPNKDKSNKKKKVDNLTQSTAVTSPLIIPSNVDDVTVGSLTKLLAKADLPRNEIQYLIDFLLNKQQDTFIKDPSEWSEGKSDPLQKLKKQLQEKEQQLRDEQDATAAIHAKLKELRYELNAEKSQSNATLRACNDELQAKKIEIQNLSQQLQILNDKCVQEKQTYQQQIQHIQAKLFQYTKDSASLQEQAKTIQQLNENNQLLQQELVNKNNILYNEKRQFEEETKKNVENEKKITEYEAIVHKNVEEYKYLESCLKQDIANKENEIKRLTLDVNRSKDEFNKKQTLQNYEIEQLKQQLNDLQTKQKQTIAANNHIDENNKVEIRNLQNALDSTKTELQSYRNEMTDYKSKISDYEQKIVELKTKEDELMKRLSEQENINLEKQNSNSSSAIDYEAKLKEFEAKENFLIKQLEEQRTKNNEQQQSTNKKLDVDVNKIILDEQNRTKEFIIKLLPTELKESSATSSTNNSNINFENWLEITLKNFVKQQQQNISDKNNHINSTNNSSNNSNNNSNNSEEKTINGNAGGGESDVDGGAEKETLLLRNAQLQKSVDDYKSIIAETESILKNLESKVLEQDVYWRTVVQSKDKEILLLKSSETVQS
uniref:Putative ribosome binding protein 1 log a dog n=1 Tax=Corethrella appendiculata TaxID=1370023 RepID=U5EQN6_9DIPT